MCIRDRLRHQRSTSHDRGNGIGVDVGGTTSKTILAVGGFSAGTDKQATHGVVSKLEPAAHANVMILNGDESNAASSTTSFASIAAITRGNATDDGQRIKVRNANTVHLPAFATDFAVAERIATIAGFNHEFHPAATADRD